jgi:hypothetical protein
VSEEILQSESDCTHLNFLLDFPSESESDSESKSQSKSESESGSKSEKIPPPPPLWPEIPPLLKQPLFASFVMVSLGSLDVEGLAQGVPWTEKHYEACTLVLTTGPGEAHPSNSSLTPFTISSLPGGRSRTFFLHLSHQQEDLELQLSKALHYTQFVQNLVFAAIPTSQENSRISLHTRCFHCPGVAVALAPLGSFTRQSSESGIRGEMNLLANYERIFKNAPNYHQSLILGQVYPQGAKNVDMFEETGVWNSYMIATLYYVTETVNASLELDTVFSMPMDGKDPDGNWDGLFITH